MQQRSPFSFSLQTLEEENTNAEVQYEAASWKTELDTYCKVFADDIGKCIFFKKNFY